MQKHVVTRSLRQAEPRTALVARVMDVEVVAGMNPIIGPRVTVRRFTSGQA